MKDLSFYYKFYKHKFVNYNWCDFLNEMAKLFIQESTDENLEKYLVLVNLQMEHFKQYGYSRIVSDEELRQLVYKARRDLKSELSRTPTVGEVNARVNAYLTPKKFDKALKESFKFSIVTVAVTVFSTMLGLIIFFWLIMNF